MTEVENIYIDIYDVTQPEVDEDITALMRFAEKASVKLIYEGSDSKTVEMLPSRLEFSMEVNIENQPDTDLYYEELFTGDEEKYKVKVIDKDNGVTLWTGFLLPEIYQEPYDRGTFYVNFAATDGLGKLKGLTLPEEMYQCRNSVIRIIAECLKLTGLRLDFKICAGIYMENKDSWENIYINGECFSSSDSYQDCHEILSEILKIMGAALWQENNIWYITGHQKKGFPKAFQQYDYNGNRKYEYSSQSLFQSTAVFENDQPLISLKPPYKTVEIRTEFTNPQNIFPDDIVEQFWEKPEKNQLTPVPKYWRGTSPERLVMATERMGLHANTLHDIDEGAKDVPLWVCYRPEYDGAPDNSQAYVDANYIHTVITPFVSRGLSTSQNNRDIRNRISLIYEFRAALTIPFEGHNEQFWRDDFQYALRLNGQVIMSNRPGTAPQNFFPLELRFEGIEIANEWSNYIISGKLNVHDFPIPEDGHLEFFIHSSKIRAVVSILVKELRVEFHPYYSNRFEKSRKIKYTSKYNEVLKIADSSIERVNTALVYQEPIPNENFYKVDKIGISEVITPLNYGRCLEVSFSSRSLMLYYQNLYVKRKGSDYYQYVQDVQSFMRFLSPLNPQMKFYFKINLTDGSEIRDDDEFFIRTDFTADPQSIQDKIDREKWQGVNQTTPVDRLGFVLADQIHGVYSKPLKFIEGTLVGLFFPSTILNFNLKNETVPFLISRAEIMFNENNTMVTLIEKSFEKITDYEQVET